MREVEKRAARLEAIRSQIPTKKDVREVVEEVVLPLAVKAELESAIAPLVGQEMVATRQELRAEIMATRGETRQRIDRLSERLEALIKDLSAELLALRSQIAAGAAWSDAQSSPAGDTSPQAVADAGQVPETAGRAARPGTAPLDPPTRSAASGGAEGRRRRPSGYRESD
jgi:hypothetical protein